MEHFQNDDLEYIVDDYYDFDDFEHDDLFAEPEPRRDTADFDSFDSDFEDDFESKKPKTDTSAVEARNGKDIQGIPWERLNFTRDKYRETRLRQYKNYESLSGSREGMEKECLQVEKGNAFYDFQFNTRLVKSTIVHFQILAYAMASVSINCKALGLMMLLRNLLWATSKHDVYLMQNYSVMHWSSLLRKGKEVLNVAKPIVPNLKRQSQQLSRVQISTMAVKENLMVAGGFQGELICKVSVCFGALRVMAANNDAQIRVFDAETFSTLNRFSFDWSVNNTSVSPDGKLLAVLGDSTDCLIADAQSGKVTGTLEGHLDYSFASAWHPDGNILATGNQDTTCRLWDVRKPSQSLAVLKGRMGAIRALKF
ncbi:hypothetical protein Goshw_010898, partial [Gossypium schwendimanii]|nr:hypothetical protein [Gossypium schwendimanii]